LHIVILYSISHDQIVSVSFLFVGTETLENRPGMRGGHQMALDVQTGKYRGVAI